MYPMSLSFIDESLFDPVPRILLTPIKHNDTHARTHTHTYTHTYIRTYIRTCTYMVHGWVGTPLPKIVIFLANCGNWL